MTCSGTQQSALKNILSCPSALRLPYSSNADETSCSCSEKQLRMLLLLTFTFVNTWLLKNTRWNDKNTFKKFWVMQYLKPHCQLKNRRENTKLWALIQIQGFIICYSFCVSSHSEANCSIGMEFYVKTSYFWSEYIILIQKYTSWKSFIIETHQIFCYCWHISYSHIFAFFSQLWINRLKNSRIWHYLSNVSTIKYFNSILHF